MDIITLKILTKAIANKMGIGEKDARRDAEFVLDLFGFQDRILDNVLEPKERQFFYELQKLGMLNSEREVVTLFNGRHWRIHYWLINKQSILKYAQDNNKTKKAITPDKQTIGSIYDTINETMWNTRKIHE